MNKAFVLTMMFLLSVSFAFAYNTQVLGTVYDSSDVPVANADVTVTCNSIQKTTTTNAYGTYNIVYKSADCGFNAPVHVEASFDDQTGSGDGFTCANVNDCYGVAVALVDVSIPEFGVIAGAVALVGALGIFMYRRK